MNIPEVYLVEPYNAYAPKGRKKHWHEVIEEQALLAKILAEANKSPTTPPNTPPISTPPIVPIPPAGGGGVMPSQVYLPAGSVSLTFSHTPSAAPAPYTCTFTNLMENPELYSYLWTFEDGDGTLSTSTEVSPTLTVHTASGGATNVVTASFVATNINLGTSMGTSTLVYASGSKPVLTVAFTLASSNSASLTAGYYTASVGDTITFTNGTTMNNGLVATGMTQAWYFADGAVTNPTSSLTNPTWIFTVAGDYIVRCGNTGSYNIMGVGTRKIKIV